MGEPPTADGAGRAVYAAYIREQLDAQEARKASLEQRGLSIIGTAGGLVTLLFGLTALAVDREDVVLSTAAQALLIAALVLFVVAGLAALVTNIPLSYQGVTTDALRGAVRERWDDAEAVALEMTSLTRIAVLESARRRNNMKSVALFAALVAEIVAVALVGGAVCLVVTA